VNQAKQLHPSPEQLAAFGLGRLSPQAQAQIERHVAQCDSCCQALRQVPDDTLLERLRQGGTPVDNPSKMSAGGSAMPGVMTGGVPRDLADHSRYRIVKSLGAGGMGVVYQAEHRLMARTVALKVINHDLTSDPHAVDRFRQEVKAAARLAHPNIVTAYDAEQAGDSHFLVMEFVNGTSLARLVEKRGPLSPGHAAHFGRQAAMGLQHAFEQGMVHRDIKPQNLMLTRQGQVKILDFGLARLARERVGNDQRSVSGITEAGACLGTPDYIAPEQASDARRADIRADIYSLGCTLYYLMLGRVPFPEGSAIEKLVAHVEQTPSPLHELRSEVPLKLSQIVAKMMAKDPAERFQTPAEVVEALTPFAASPKIVAKSASGGPQEPAPAHSAVNSKSKAVPGLAGWRMALWFAFAMLVVGCLMLAVPAIRRVLQSEGQTNQDVQQTGRTSDVIAKAADSPKNSGTKATDTTSLPILVVVPQKYWYADFVPMRDVLEKEGKRVVKVASSSLKACQPMDNSGGTAEVTPNMVLNQDVRAADYAALVFVGGLVSELKDDPHPGAAQTRRLIDEMIASKKYVAALCWGQRILAAKPGAVQGKQVAGNHARIKADVLREYANCGAIWVDQSVVVDGYLITGAEPKDAAAFARTLLQCLNKNP
jgi:serine/threonine protein kinase/putative intracellular protease/amidase